MTQNRGDYGCREKTVKGKEIGSNKVCDRLIRVGLYKRSQLSRYLHEHREWAIQTAGLLFLIKCNFHKHF